MNVTRGGEYLLRILGFVALEHKIFSNSLKILITYLESTARGGQKSKRTGCSAMLEHEKVLGLCSVFIVRYVIKLCHST